MRGIQKDRKSIKEAIHKILRTRLKEKLDKILLFCDFPKLSITYFSAFLMCRYSKDLIISCENLRSNDSKLLVI